MVIPAYIKTLSYIRGSGTQYITTDIYLRSTDIIKSKWRFEGQAGNTYGCYTSGGADDNFCLYAGSQSANAYIRYNGQAVREFKPATGTIHELEHGPDGFYDDGVKLVDFDPATFTCSAPMYIFMLPNSTSAKVSARCYGLRIYRDGALAYNFIPAKDSRNDEVGMLESVNGVWYSNAGTGAFTAGPEVVVALKSLLLMRRRELMAAATHMEPVPGSDGKVWAYFNINESGKDNRLIAYSTYGISAIEVDGDPIPLATTYDFPSAGRYLVKYTLQGGNKYVSNLFREVAVNEVYLPTDGRIVLEASNQFLYSSNWLEKVRGNTSQMLRFYSTTAARALYSSTADVELTGVTNFGSIVAGNNIHRMYVKGTFSSMPNSSITGYGAASNFREVWIESPNLTSIGTYFCRNMQNLERVVVNVPAPPTLGTNPFDTTNNTFKIYVPYSADHSILDAYKTASRWSTYASRMYELNQDGTIPEPIYSLTNHVMDGTVDTFIDTNIAPFSGQYNKVWIEFELTGVSSTQVAYAAFFECKSLDGNSYGATVRYYNSKVEMNCPPLIRPTDPFKVATATTYKGVLFYDGVNNFIDINGTKRTFTGSVPNFSTSLTIGGRHATETTQGRFPVGKFNYFRIYAE